MSTKQKTLDRATELDELLLSQRPTEVLKLTTELLQEHKSNLFYQRIMLHFKGLALIHLDQPKEALACLESARQLGDNVSLLRDLACCYYQLADMKRWRRTYSELANVIGDKKKKIQAQALLQAQNTLAKFYEEEGRVNEALKLYESILHQAEKDQQETVIPLFLTQLIRLRALFGQTEGLGALYAELISLHENQASQDLQFEIHHSLMLAEMTLIGPDHAWLRVEDSLQNEHLSLADKRLIFYDYLEEMLLKEMDLPATCFRWKDQLKGQDPFEQEIHCLAFFPERRKDFLALGRLTPSLSWASYLRLLILYFRMAETPEKATEVKNKIYLILDAVESDSRPFWLRRMKMPLEESRITLEFEPERRLIQFENKQLDLSRKKGMLALLKLLVEHREQSIEDAIHQIWSSPYSPEYYHRLRMTAHRLNQLLFDLTSVSKVVEVNSDQVSLRPAVHFKLCGSPEIGPHS